MDLAVHDINVPNGPGGMDGLEVHCIDSCHGPLQMEKDDKGSTMIRMGVSG